MTLPANWSTVTVTGTYLNIDGEPLKGTVAFSTTTRVVDAGANVTVPPGVRRVSLDNDGKFSVVLPATDDPDAAPTGFTYRVDEDLVLPTGARSLTNYLIQLPAATPTVDLADVVPVTPVAEMAPYARLDAPNVFTRDQTVQGALTLADGFPAASQEDVAALLTVLGYMTGAVETAPRMIDGNYGAVNGRVNLSYVTAYRAQAITQLGTCTKGTAVGGLTAARWGLYAVAANGDLTLVARTAQNTTTAYGSTFAEYVAPLNTTGGYPASYTLQAGKVYALAQIVTFTATAPVLRGYATNLPTTTAARSPRLNGTLGGQADLPASISAGAVGGDGNSIYLFGLA